MRPAFRRFRALLVCAAAGVAVAVPSAGLAAPESIDDRPGIKHVEVTGSGIEALVSVPVGSEVDLEAVRVTIGGETVTAKAASARSARVSRTAVLAIDTSNSMRGDRFGSAKQAALAFVSSLPDDVRLGIVSFDSEVDVELTPSTDRQAARTVISELELSRDTRLYDGVVKAVELAGTSGQRSVLVLSDGADTSGTPLEEIVGKVERSGVLLDVVALEQEGVALENLATLAESGQGRVVASERKALTEAFAAEAEVLAHQVVVTAAVPADLRRTEADVVVTLPNAASGPDVVAETFTTVQDSVPPAPTAVQPVTAEPAWSLPTWGMYAGVLALGAGLVGMAVLLVPRGPAPLSAADRVTSYVGASAGGPTGGPGLPDAEAAFNQAKDAAADLLRRNKSLEARITARLDAAGSQLKSSEWLLVHTGVFLGSGLVGVLLGQGSIATGAFFLVLGAVGPWIYLGFRASRRRKAFEALLPETLQLMSGSLAAGLSLAQSVDTIVREGAEPISSEFKRVLMETRLGVTLEDAFEGVAERFESQDFAWVVMAIKIQRQVGGNLAELLDTVAATMREREYMRRQVAALAAEGKLSAWVLGLLPPLFLLYLVLTNGEYVRPMFTEPVGWVMLGGAGLLLGLGVFWMSRLVKVEV